MLQSMGLQSRTQLRDFTVNYTSIIFLDIHICLYLVVIYNVDLEFRVKKC